MKEPIRYMQKRKAYRHMRDLFEQGLFSNFKFDDRTGEFNNMFRSCFVKKQVVEQEAVKNYIKEFYDREDVDEICKCVSKTIDLS